MALNPMPMDAAYLEINMWKNMKEHERTNNMIIIMGLIVN